MNLRRRSETLAVSIHARKLCGFGGSRARRGQTLAESLAALVVLAVAFAGAWILYKDAIIETTRAMIAFFRRSPEG
jgi:type II secretory pathway component PulJ